MHARVAASRGKREVTAQAALLMLASLAAAAPPAEGTIAILPVVPGDTAATYRWAFEAGARPIAPGPYPGALVVQGSLGTLALPAVSHGALLIAARFGGCGAQPL